MKKKPQMLINVEFVIQLMGHRFYYVPLRDIHELTGINENVLRRMSKQIDKKKRGRTP